MTSRVFVPSLPTRYDAATQKQVPSLDLNPATKHGTLKIITSGPQATGDRLVAAIEACVAAASDVEDGYDYYEGDSVLAVGDSILQAAFIAKAVEGLAGDGTYHPVRVLRWDRKNNKYDEVEIEIC